MWVVMPVMLGQLVLELSRLWRGPTVTRRWAPSAAVLAIVGILVLPTAWLSSGRAHFAKVEGMPEARFVPDWYAPDPDLAEQTAASYLGLERAFVRAGAEVPRDACILSIKPSVVELLSSRRSAVPPDIGVSDADFPRAIDASHCEYALLVAFGSPSFPGAWYPRDRLDALAWTEVFREAASLPFGVSGDVAILLRRVK
jgi:hypothetical protein